MFQGKSGIYVFKSKQYIPQFTSLDFYIFPGGFRCIPGGFSYLPGGQFTASSHSGKVLKIWHFPRWVKQSLPGYWDRVFYINIWSLCKAAKDLNALAGFDSQDMSLTLYSQDMSFNPLFYKKRKQVNDDDGKTSKVSWGFHNTLWNRTSRSGSYLGRIVCLLVIWLWKTSWHES